MPAFIETWDESKPAGGRDISLGDDDLREFKRAQRERDDIDHWRPADETGIATVGYHRKVTLPALATDPDVVSGAGIFYSKDVGSGQIEAFFIDAAGNITQLTNKGQLKTLSKGVTMWFGQISELPLGWYLCNGLGGRPDLRDRFVVGARQDDSGSCKTTVEGSLAQSANPTHTHGGNTGSTVLAISQIPAHTHTISMRNSNGFGTVVQNSDAQNQSNSIESGSAGGGLGHDHTIAASTSIPPYFALALVSQYNV